MPKGLYRKYTIAKADGTPVDPRAEYFVLRLDTHAADINHVEACRRALMTYANEIEPFIPKLAADLRNKYGMSVVPYKGFGRAPEHILNHDGHR